MALRWWGNRIPSAKPLHKSQTEKLNLGLRTSAPLLQNPCCTDTFFMQEVLLSLLDVK